MPALKMTRLPDGYRALSADRIERGELKNGNSRDCAVVALTIVTGLSYATCHEALKAAGRRDRRSTHKHIQRKALESLGFKVREWSSKEMVDMCYGALRDHGKKVAGITTHHPRRFPKTWAPHRDKALLLYSRGHVSAMIGGVVQDWAINRSKQVYMIWEVTKA